MNTCLIPVYDRAELLHHVLRCIEKADGTQDILFLFKPDQGNPHPSRAQRIAMGECLEVMGAFKLNFQVIPYGDIPRIPAQMRQSWNLLTGYAIAARTAGEGGLVYMVESDVIVGREFFHWHNFTHKAYSAFNGLFCSIASEDTNTSAEEREKIWNKADDHSGGYLSEGTYRSIGVCWRAEILHDHIGPHCKDAYFLNATDYVNSMPSPWGRTWCEQDGLIRRIQLNQPLPIAYPFEPKCYHAGYYGGNRGNTRHAPKGSLQQRIEQVGRVIYSDSEMQRVNAHKREYYEDSRPIDLGHTVISEVTSTP